MGNVSETGHAVNIANFKKGIDYCDSLGGNYAPSNTDLTIANMTAKWMVSSNLQTAVNNALINSKTPINDREALFEPLSRLITSVLNSAKSSKLSADFINDLKGMAEAIRGVKSKTPKKNADGSLNPDFVSNSHLSYVMKTDNFEKFVLFLETEPTLYAPNEPELATADLRALLMKMISMNNAIGTILAPMKNARIARDIELYDKVTGVGKIFANCKSYIRSKYGAKSVEASFMNDLKYTMVKLTS